MKPPLFLAGLLAVILALAPVDGARGADSYAVIHAFDAMHDYLHGDFSNQEGYGSLEGLTLGADGNYYGLNVGGGPHLAGTFFKMTPAGAVTRLFAFAAKDQNTGLNATGASPSRLAQAADGSFYGFTQEGGDYGLGTFFRFTTGGTEATTSITVLRHLDNTSTAPASVRAILRGSDGALYATATQNGASHGLLLKIVTDGTSVGTTFTILHQFAGQPTDGEYPAGLTEGADGLLYGTTMAGGSYYNAGTVYRAKKDGTGFTIMHNFGATPNEGISPEYTPLVEADGTIYGSTPPFYPSGNGSIYRIKADGTFTTLKLFQQNEDGGSGASGLVAGTDGLLYGTVDAAVHTQGYLFSIARDGSRFEIRHIMPESDGTNIGIAKNTEGLNPTSPMSLHPNGSFYIHASDGGPNGSGTVVKFSPTQRPPAGFTTLHTMSAPLNNQTYPTNLDGAHINGPLIRARDGAYYGVAREVGPHASGTIFKITADGAFTRLYAFSREDGSGNNPDGELPINGLTQAGDNSFFGVTQYGGTVGQGVIFRFTTDGTEAGTQFTPLLYLNSQSGTVNGAIFQIIAPFVLASDNCFYAPCIIAGQNGGGICKLSSGNSADSTTLSVLCAFDYNASQLGRPEGPLVEGPDHVLYGMARVGGPSGLGAIYRVNKDGSQPTLIHAFGQDYPNDGENPVNGLTIGPDGAFYGATGAITANTTDFATLFRMTTDGSAPGTSLTTIHAFPSGTSPSDLTFGIDGKIYGTTPYSGANYHGSIFSLNTDGSDYAEVYSLADRIGNAPGVEGASPGKLTLDPVTGSFFGSTLNEGANDYGTVFRYTPPLGALPAVTSFSASGPASVGQPITFTATTGAGLAVRVQASATPNNEASWTDLPGGGAMTENDPANPGAGNYRLVASAYPFGSAISFRALAAKTGYTDGKSTPLGPYNLVATATLSANGPSGDGQPIHFAVSTVGGFAARIEYNKTPGDGTTWKPLGAATETSAGNYTLDSSAYPNGSGIAFRAAVTKTGYDDIISAPLTGYTLHNAELTISCILSSLSAPQDGSIVHPGEPLQVSFIVTNVGSVQAKSPRVEAVFPPYGQVHTAAQKQFQAKDLTFSSGGHYVAASSPSALDAKAVWDLGDIDAGLSASAVYTVIMPADIDYPRTYGITNATYSVRSTATPPVPAGVVTGETTNQPQRETLVKPPISFTLTSTTPTVAPGGLLTYEFTLSNLGPASVAHAIAAVEVPDFVRYAETYKTTAGTEPAVKYVSKRGTPSHKHVYYQNGTHSQVVVNAGVLYPKGDKAHRDSVTFSVTFQAQWVDPSQVTLQQLSTIHYGATFLTPANSKTHTNPYLAFTLALAASPTTPKDGAFYDYLSFFQQSGVSSSFTEDDSGIVKVTFSGSAANGPVLTAVKFLSNDASATEQDGDGSVDVVVPGGRATFVVTMTNRGHAPAEDVYLQNTIPDYTSYVPGSAALVNRNTSTQRSKLDNLPPDAHHVRFTGLHLEQGQTIVLQYTVQMAAGAAAPPVDTLLDIGSAVVGTSSTPITWEALVAEQYVKVGGQVLFAQPLVRTLIPRPGVSADLSTTANALTAIYNQTPSALPLTTPADLLSYISGVQRYYVHYKNVGPVTARGAQLDFPLPAHTAFYRASFVKLATNAGAHGDPGLLPGKLIASPPGTRIVPPDGANNGFLATSGKVSFILGQPAPGAEGDVMVELIVSNDAVVADGALVGGEDVTIYDSTVAPSFSAAGPHEVKIFGGAHQAKATLTAIPLADPQHVPTVGLIARTSTGVVTAGDTFQVRVLETNTGEFACHSIIGLQIPEGTIFVSADAGQNLIVPPAAGEEGPGHFVYVNTTTNNGPLPNGTSMLNPHSCGGMTVTLRATAPAGTTISIEGINVSTQFSGKVYAPPAAIRVSAFAGSQTAPIYAAAGVPVLALNNGAALVDLGGGFAVAQGGLNVISNDGGTLIGQDGNGLVITGAASAIKLSDAGKLVNPTVADAFAHRDQLLSDAGGNILVPGGASIVAQGGGNILAPGVTSLVGPSGGTVVAQGGGNVISNDGGTLIGQDGNGLIGQDGNGIIGDAGASLLSDAGGNYIAAGGGVVSRDAAGLVNTNGSNLVNTNGSNVVSSAANSRATVRAADGTTFIVGGASFHPVGP